MKHIHHFFIGVLLGLSSINANATEFSRQDISVAGLFPVSDSGRKIFDFNSGWRYHQGKVDEGGSTILNDNDWEIVSIPHTVSLIPTEGSGCRNYQGEVWYRKHFVMPKNLSDMDIILHFEAIMGKQRFFINGKEVAAHKGGYLPINISLSDAGIMPGDSCLVAVMADNSDDSSFPPGKPQTALDFAYHGGIYRDVWMIAKSPISITDAIESNKVAGGGIFVHFDNITGKSADIFIDTELCNASGKNKSVTLESTLLSPQGVVLKKIKNKSLIPSGDTIVVKQQLQVSNPQLWSPDSPSLYRIETRVKDGETTIDGGMTRIGIRDFQFDPQKGFILNGKPFGQLVGANRHQDFAYVGNAVPNSQQWRDAKRLRDAGCRIIRVAHYPQDPAFMDACDELGMFVIVATPGWQFWNRNPEFERLVHKNTRSMIRRDRNHPSVIMWEPILNETGFPESFALKALEVTKEEYPYPGRPLAAADMNSKGVRDNYDIVYGWWGDENKENAPKQCIFTREFGEYVDDWYSHNAPNRASRSWGEEAMKIQSLSLADTYGKIYQTNGKYVGGALWHPFDHQRGYHPDPYWGGIFDAFRQPKYAYYMFRSQTAHDLHHPVAESGPMLKIIHEMSPFSDSDVMVFSNCDSVRLSMYDGTKTWTLPVMHNAKGLPSEPVIFKDVWKFNEARSYSYKKKWKKVNMKAEGIVDGKVVFEETKMPSRRSTRLSLKVDWEGKPLIADGSDFIVVIAEVTDDMGNVRRLAKDNIIFEVEGEGEVIGGADIHANPRPVEWGTAPVLIRSTRTPGNIKITARSEFQGAHVPVSAEITIQSMPSSFPPVYSEERVIGKNTQNIMSVNREILTKAEKSRILNEVETQQTEFGIKEGD